MVVYTKPEYMKDKTVDLNDKKDKKGKKGQCRNCLHTIKVTYGLNMATGYDEHIPAFITLDDVVIQSSAYTNKVVCDLRESMQKSMRRLRKAVIVQGAAILILALTQLLR